MVGLSVSERPLESCQALYFVTAVVETSAEPAPLPSMNGRAFAGLGMKPEQGPILRCAGRGGCAAHHTSRLYILDDSSPIISVILRALGGPPSFQKSRSLGDPSLRGRRPTVIGRFNGVCTGHLGPGPGQDYAKSCPTEFAAQDLAALISVDVVRECRVVWSAPHS